MSTAGGGDEERLQQARERGGPQAAELEGHANGGVSCLQVLAFFFLTFNLTLALYHSRNDPWNVTFILASYAGLFALFLILRRFETTPEASIRQRANLKMWIWVLCSAVVVMFSPRAAGVIPFPVVILIGILAVLNRGFYGLFIYGGGSGDDSKADGEVTLVTTH